MFDMAKYAEFYCQQVVNILRQRFNKFRQNLLQQFEIDPLEYISAPSLSNALMEKNAYIGHNLYKVGGVVRDYLAGAVYMEADVWNATIVSGK